MDLGIIPDELLLVQICPLHKGGSRADPANFRPVALTSHLIKSFELVLRKFWLNIWRHQESFQMDSMGPGHKDLP